MSWENLIKDQSKAVGVHFINSHNQISWQWAIPENIHTIPRTALRISEGEGGFTIMEFWRHGGVAHFGISEGKEGLKHGSRPWLGMDIFWNCPMYKK